MTDLLDVDLPGQPLREQTRAKISRTSATACCPALKMPMSAALWVPMVRGEKTPPGVASAGFRRRGAGGCRHGAGGVSR
jgi:hypothetical protein